MIAVEAENLLTQCYRNCLTLAAASGLGSIAFPAISCGVYGYPIEDASRVALRTTCRFLDENAAIQKVVFILFSESDRQVYERQLEALR